MSEKYDKLTKFKVEPTNLERLKKLQEKQPIKPSLAALCNACLALGIKHFGK